MIVYSDRFLKAISWTMNIAGITLWPFIVLREKYKDSTSPRTKILVNHEKIHLAQQRECLVIPFYLIYLVEFIFKGYRGISFEREAFENDDDLDYLKKRKPYAWRKYRK